MSLKQLSQMTPGPIGINTATYAGYRALEYSRHSSIAAVAGAALATIALCLPSFIMISVISYFFLKFRFNKYFSNAMIGIRPLSVALIAIAAPSLTNEGNFVSSMHYPAI